MSRRRFKTESKRLLNIMINSIYTHREIFLREIVSNASDAIDKLNYKALTDPASGIVPAELGIRIAVDDEARTITVSDNGIGMTGDEMDKNLGVIAHSGSLGFKEQLDDDADSGIIGRFGVGFYSAFMVSDRVTVVSRAFGSDEAHAWESDGKETYSLKPSVRETVGTDVIMHIREDVEDDDFSRFLDRYEIEDLVKKYSDYIRWPIRMEVETGRYVETGETGEDGEPEKEYVTSSEDKVLNSMVPVWKKGKAEVTDAECAEFYKTRFHDFEDPVAVIRADAEGAISYKAMLFIPGRAPYDFYTRDFRPGLQLYSNGVMIMERCEDLLPFFFRFVRGVVDSPDFSLNISREVLQHDRQLRSVGANLTKKVKAELERLMKDDRETYERFYRGFGRQLEYGVVEEYGRHKDMLEGLLLFRSAATGKMVSFADHVAAMPEGQDRIYYVSAETYESAKTLPQTEPLTERGYDFLCLTEDVHEFVMNTIREYGGKELCNITTDDLGLESEDEKKEADARTEEFRELLDFVKETLGDRVGAVRLSRKLRSHAVLLTSEGQISIEMEKYFMNAPGAEEREIKADRVLELNADHPAVAALAQAFADDRERAGKLSRILYDQAVIVAGLPLEDAVGYSDRVLGLF